MKKLITIAILMVVALAGTNAMAGAGSVFGTQATAVAIGHRAGYFGLGLGVADLTSVVGTFDYGLSKYTTGRLKLGFADDGAQSDLQLSMGAEMRWQIWQVGGINKRPIDLAIGPMIEYFKFDEGSATTRNSLSIFQFGGFLLGSHSFAVSGGQLMTPYAKLNVRIEDAHLKTYTGINVSNSDLKVGLGTGVAYQLTNTINLYGEFQVDGNNGLFIGADFKVM